MSSALPFLTALITLSSLPHVALAKSTPVQCSREILKGALFQQIKAVPNAAALQDHTFSITRSILSNELHKPSLVTVEMANKTDGTTVTVDYSVMVVSLARCKVQATEMTD